MDSNLECKLVPGGEIENSRGVSCLAALSLSRVSIDEIDEGTSIRAFPSMTFLAIRRALSCGCLEFELFSFDGMK